jgi:hypothetical protein
MSGQERCRNGSQGCEYDDKHELALVGEVMRVINDYNKKEDIDPCPLCLRDTMLAVAALLQLEAARLKQASTERRAASVTHLGNVLAKAAREQLKHVIHAKATIVSRSRN